MARVLPTYRLLVTINPAVTILGSPPTATIGVPYSYTLTYYGGTAPYVCTVVGSVPSGWSFDAATGEISHASPTTPGPVSLTLRLRDSEWTESNDITFTWDVIALPIAITNEMPNYTAGVPVDFTYTATGGVGAKTFAITSGSLPPGLTMGSDGHVTGNTTGVAVGLIDFFFTVTATDTVAAFGVLDEVVGVTVVAINITNSAATPGREGVAYTHTYTSSGGTGTKTWSSPSGTIPPGLSLSSAGVLSGTPTTPSYPTTYTFGVRVTDNAGTQDTDSNVVMILYPVIGLSGTYTANAVQGVSYSSDLTISGGDGTYSNPRVTIGSLPAGLSVTVASGNKLRVSGTPSGTGAASFTVAVDSGDGQTATSAQSITVYSAISLSGSYSTPGQVGTSYSSDLTIAGGSGSYSNPRATSGTVPAGLSLSVSGGTNLRLSGTPTTATSYSFTAAVDSSDGQTATSAQTVVINPNQKDFDDISGLRLWLDFNDTAKNFTNTICTTQVASNGDKIRGAKNKAAAYTGGNWTNSGGGSNNDITYTTGGPNGGAYAVFASGVSTYLSSGTNTLADYITNTDFLIVAVCRVGNGTSVTSTAANYTGFTVCGGGAFSGCGLMFKTSSDTFFAFNHDGVRDYDAGQSVAQDTWKVVAIQHKSGNIRSTLDGVTWSSNVASGNTSNTGNALTVGKNPDGTANTGTLHIRELGVYNASVSDSDVEALINKLKARSGL